MSEGRRRYFSIKAIQERMKNNIPVDYSTGKIYMLYSSSSDVEPYIGITRQDLKMRLLDHYKGMDEGTGDESSYVHLLAGDAEIELLEKYPCESRAELEMRRKWWIKKVPNCNENK